MNEIFKKLTPELVNIYGERLHSIILYGSVARGTAMEDSDIDVAIILKSHTHDMDERMLDIAAELELEYDVVLSVVKIEYETFMKWRNVLPYYKNIQKEGVILWKAA